MLTDSEDLVHAIAPDEACDLRIEVGITPSAPLDIGEQEYRASTRSRSPTTQEVQRDGERLQVAAVGIIDEGIALQAVLDLQTHRDTGEGAPRFGHSEELRGEGRHEGQTAGDILKVGGIGEGDGQRIFFASHHTDECCRGARRLGRADVDRGGRVLMAPGVVGLRGEALTHRLSYQGRVEAVEERGGALEETELLL